MPSMTWRRTAAALVMTVVAATGLTVVEPPPAVACPTCDVDTDPNGGSVTVTFEGSAVSTTHGSSSSVPPDCWYEDWLSVEEAFVIRVLNSFFGFLFIPFLQLPMGPLAEYRDAFRDHKDDDGWRWYRLRCRAGISTIDSQQALSTAQTTEWFGRQVARMDLLVGPGTSTPSGVSVETLLEVAQDAFTVPEPDVQQNPTIRGADGATLVNLDTWFWADAAQETHTITATAGPVSVSLTARNTGYTLTSPYGSTECTHEQFTTPWSAELDGSPEAGCTIAFDRASDGAGHEVQVTSQWEMTWTATGVAGTNTLDPITPSTTFNVPVVEQGAVVEEID